MADLIERLRADAELIHNNGITRKLRRHRVAALLREAAAALEAARELANKWRKSEGGPYAYVAMQCAEQLNAAIDQSRGKGVQGEA